MSNTQPQITGFERLLGRVLLVLAIVALIVGMTDF